MKTVTVYLVRHGQTWFNVFGKMQGWSDSPLTDKGIADAHRAAAMLSHITFTHAYCSDTMRARNTAETILAKLQHQRPTHRDQVFPRAVLRLV